MALVKFADSLFIRLIKRDQQKSLTILNANNDEEEYEIKAIFPFSSETKRMGIVVRHIQSDKLIFYLKGAENVMKYKVRPYQRATVNEKCDGLALEGLRTLVIT